MPKEILDYLKTQRIGVLSVEMPDGSPHGATIHFAYSETLSAFIFETNRNYRKSQPIQKGPTRASLVIGFSEEEMKTLQLDGEAIIIDKDDALVTTYFDKFPNKKSNIDNPDAIFFKFVPTWWRFTDWKTVEGKKIFNSDGTVEVKNKL